MTQMFATWDTYSSYAPSKFNGDLSKWQTSRVTSFYEMFRFAENFNGDLSKWSTPELTTTQGMFSEATAFNSDISSWKMDKVITLKQM